jgi:hypothetical protein
VLFGPDPEGDKPASHGGIPQRVINNLGRIYDSKGCLWRDEVWEIARWMLDEPFIQWLLPENMRKRAAASVAERCARHPCQAAELRKQKKSAEATKGVIVIAVTAGSPAQEKGIVTGISLWRQAVRRLLRHGP